MRRTLWLLSHGALCFHAAPVTDIGYVDEAIGAGDWFTVHRGHPPLTSWTIRVRGSEKTMHIGTGNGDTVNYPVNLLDCARAPRRCRVAAQPCAPIGVEVNLALSIPERACAALPIKGSAAIVPSDWGAPA